MNHYETSELPAKSDFSNNDSSHALFADTMGSNPFKLASKQETVMLASNDGYHTEPHGPGIPDVPPVIPPVEPHNYQLDQQQAQQQQQAQEQLQQQQLNNRNDLSNNSANYNRNDVNSANNNDNRVQGSVEGNINGTVSGTNKLQNNVDASSTNTVDASNSVRTGNTNVNTGATNVRTGDTIYKNNSYANARGEALPGNDCQLFAVRGDGYFLGTGGGAGLSVSSEECIKARAEKVTCDASVSLGVANQYNSAAEQSWLQHVNPAQQQQIIEHGMRNTQRISDNAVNKSAECTKVNQEEEEAQEQPQEVIIQRVDTSSLATKQELQQAEERSIHRVNQAFKHSLQK
ncbi:MAG: hypothetical protein QG574_2505 [Cyanobacteriota bacterium erpe_2018_sw_21hr_WHONDRS-SW48-000092_B_bin.40]|nr:hypothetical protein [Cyanobacteriota bacterium erpe_2018_sw_21hr_WHONDRS-SW48-000092_B_bin.40]